MTGSSSTLEADVRVNNGPVVKGELTVEQEFINVESQYQSKPDVGWEFVDAAGHWHAFGQKAEPFEELPTLRATSVKVPCDGSCGGDCGGEGYHRTEYRCRLCDAVVEPHRLPDPGPRMIPGLFSWRLEIRQSVESEGYRRFEDPMVTVRVKTQVGEFFGVAAPTGFTVSRSGATATALAITKLMGSGPLGRRSVPPKCTCPLIDVSTSTMEPQFVLGDPKGCKVHGRERDAAIEAARRAARGEVPDPFYVEAATDG